MRTKSTDRRVVILHCPSIDLWTVDLAPFGEEEERRHRESTPLESPARARPAVTAAPRPSPADPHIVLLPPEPPKPLVLSVVATADPRQAGARLRFSDPVVHIGRGLENDLVFDDPLVSRSHLQIFWDGERWQAHDVGSRNGTLIDGRPSTGISPLSAGSTIVLGKNTLMFGSAGPETDDESRRPVRESTMDL